MGYEVSVAVLPKILDVLGQEVDLVSHIEHRDPKAIFTGGSPYKKTPEVSDGHQSLPTAVTAIVGITYTVLCHVRDKGVLNFVSAT